DGPAWERRVLAIAEKFRPGCGHRLIPEAAADWLESLPAMNRKVARARAQLRELTGSLLAGALLAHPWVLAHAGLNDGAAHENRNHHVLRPVLQWLANADADTEPATAFARLLHACGRQSDFREQGFGSLAINLRERNRQAEPWPALCRALGLLDD